MANYAASVLTAAQATLATKYNEAELRRKQRPVINMAIGNSQYCLPDHQELSKAEARSVTVKYLNKIAAGSTTAKAVRHTGTKGDSTSITLSWNTIIEKFYISRKMAQNNVFGLQTLFQNQLEQAILNILDRAETAAVTSLFATRAQIASPATGGAGTWDATNFNLGIDAAKAGVFYQHAKSFMFARLYRGEFDVIADLTAYRAAEYNASQGGGNSTNLGFQFVGLNIAPTVDTISSSYDGQVLIMPSKSFAGLDWNDPANRQGIKEDAYVGQLMTMADPFGSGATLDVSVYTDRRDESSAGGHVQDIVDEWEIALNIGWALPPLTTANDSVVHHIVQSA
jgi:hypothetical protein